MPVEIKPSGQVQAGFVATRRSGGATALDALADALRGVTALGKQEFKAAEQKELEETTNLLSSPGLTEEEAQEIADDVNFPLNRIKAENRIGEVRVQQQLDAIQDEVDRAPDALEARRVLHTWQGRLLEGIEANSAVAAGVREALARESAAMLRGASQRRVAARAAEEQINLSEGLRLGLEHGGADSFVNFLVPQLEDDALTNGDVSASLTTAAQTIENYWREGDDLDPSRNVNATEAIDSIDAVLANVSMDSADRGKFSALRDRIVSGEESRRQASLKEAPLSERHARAIDRAFAWQRANPDQPLPGSFVQEIRTSAPTASARQNAEDWLEQNAIPQGVLYNSLWEDGQSLLRQQFQAFAGSIENISASLYGGASLADVVTVYNSIGANLPPELNRLENREELRRIREQAVADAPRLAQERAQARKDREQQLTERMSQLNAAVQAARSAGDNERAARFEREGKARAGVLARASLDDGVKDWLELRGYDPSQFVGY